MQIDRNSQIPDKYSQIFEYSIILTLGGQHLLDLKEPNLRELARNTKNVDRTCRNSKGFLINLKANLERGFIGR